MTPDLDRLRETERWIAWVRLAAVPFAIVEVGLLSTDYPPGYEGWAWATTGLLAVVGVGFFLLSRWEGFARAPRLIGLLGLTSTPSSSRPSSSSTSTRSARRSTSSSSFCWSKRPSATGSAAGC